MSQPLAQAARPAHSPRVEVCKGFVSYQCWKVSKEWRRQDGSKKAADIAEFQKAIQAQEGAVEVKAFSTAGLKADVDFMLWNKSKTLDGIHSLGWAQRATEFSRWNDLQYNYMAMLKGSPYAERAEEGNPELHPGPYKYLFIYPFVKTRPWYLLPLEERMRVMKGHIETSKAFPMVKINTSYSFGIDDQDFVVAFESNEADQFVNLVQKLRETESSLYTQRDTPMYVGVSTPLDEILKTL